MNRRPLLRDIHVVNPYRWNRAKSIFAALNLIGAIICVGGLEGEGPMPAPGLAAILLGIAGVTLWRVDFNWGVHYAPCQTCEGYCVCD